MADEDHKALGYLGNPTGDNFENIVLANQIQSYSINSKDITNAKIIFGTHLEGVRGKAVRRTPKRLNSDCVAIPRDFQLFHKSVTLVVDVFFVDGIHF